MSDQPVTLAVLAKFHREVLLPDVQRIVGEAQTRLRDEMHTLHDSVLLRFERLEDEYQSIKAGLQRLEERLGRVEERLDRVEGRLERVEGRLDTLEVVYQDLIAAFHRFEERLSRMEKRLEELVAAHERDVLREEVSDLRARLDALQTQVRVIESRLKG